MSALIRGAWLGVFAVMALLGCGRATCARKSSPDVDAPSPPSPPAPQTEADAEAPADADELGESADPEPATPEERALLKRLNKLRRSRSVQYRAPSAEEERDFGAWVSAAIRAARTNGPPPESAPDGFRIELLEHGAPSIWLLAERQQDRRGAGAIAIRTGRARELAVEAPHTFHDRGTLPIAAAVFEATSARALLVNTVHRDSALREPAEGAGAGEDERAAATKRSASDVAHAPRSFFQVAHEALLAGVPGLWTVQLHGFNDDAAPGVSMIISAAGTSADAAGAASVCRTRLGDAGVRAFPTEIKVLGGLTNVQAKSSARAGSPFYHIEMGRSLRDRLVKDAGARRSFAESLPAPPAPENPPPSTNK